MFKWRLIWVIFCKELREGLRDRHTLLITYVLPLIIYPIAMIWAFEVVSIEQQKLAHTVYRIAVVGNRPPGLNAELNRHKKEIMVVTLDTERSQQLEQLTAGNDSRAEVLSLLRQTKLHGLILSRRTFGPGESGPRYNIGYYYDDSDLAGLAARRVAWGLLEKVNRAVRDSRLKKYGITLEEIYPIQINSTSVTDAQAFAVKHTSSLVVYLLLVFMCLCAYYPALNSTVGERERGTLATLLSTPARARELVLGKYFGVFFFCLAGISMYALEPAISTFWLVPKLALRPLPNSWWVLVGPLLATTALVVAVTICVGLVARRVTEGQAFLSMTMMFLLFPTAAAALSDSTLSSHSAFVPFFNIALVMKQFTQETLPIAALLITTGVNLALACALVALAINSLEGEYLAQPGVSDVLSFDRKILRRSNPALAMILFLGVLGGSFYLNMALQNQSIFLMVGATHLGVMFVMPWLVYRYFNLKWSEAIPHQPVPAQAYAGALLAAAALALLMVTLVPQSSLSKEMAEELAKRFAGLDQNALGAFLILTVLAILPGIFEELAFRGYLFTGLAQGFSPWWTITLTSLMFGVNHFSLLRLLPTTFVGLILGLVVWRRRSIYPTMLFHAVYNTSVLLLGSRLTAGNALPGYAIGVAAGVFVLGLSLLMEPWKRATPDSQVGAPAPLKIAK